MKRSYDDYLVITGYMSLIIGLLLCAFDNISDPWQSIFISLGVIISFTIKQFLMNIKSECKTVFIGLFILDIGIIFALNMISDSPGVKFLYFAVIYQVIFSLTQVLSGIFISLIYFLDFLSIFHKLGLGKGRAFINNILFDLITYTMIVIIIVLLKNISGINKELERSKHSLSIKNIELKEAYENVREAYRKNEEYVISEERNKLAREIHDTVGHTLTTALVEMEASSILLDKDIDKADQKLKCATEQVRKGLMDIRHSVRTLTSKDIDCYQEIFLLINNTVTHAGVIIRYDIDDFEKENDSLKKCIYRSLQEGLTNGIRHGGASAFLFKLKYFGDVLKFSLEDNGKGCTQVQKGFGLKAMEERTRENGGTLQIISEYDDGFNIYIDFSIDG